PPFYADLCAILLSPLPYAIAKYRSSEMRRRIYELTRDNRFDVVVCDFLAPTINLPRDLSCPSILFQHNVEAMIWKRRYQVEANSIKKTYLYGQWRKMLAFEGVMCRRFDRVVAVSREDRELMQHEYRVISVSDVPSGVDAEFFRPHGAEQRDPYNLVFTGSMDWLPNEDAVRYFTS